MKKGNEYFGRSTILLMAMSFFPLLHAQVKKTDCTSIVPKNLVYVVAHRGAHNGIPENSLAAYRKAIELGCDFVEIDVRTTKDGKFVSIHNSTVDKYASGSKGKVSELNLDELRSLDIGINTGPEWKGTKIPTFEEILDLCHGKIGIYLDLKAASVSQLVEIIKKYGMEKEIVWYISASDSKDINELKTNCPQCIPMPDPGPASNIENTIARFNICLIASDMDALGKEYVKIAHSHNIMVMTDEKDGTDKEWQKMIDLKTDGIQTDKPEELITFLKSLEKNNY
jgi:glycerophosphoryl diester phosphodiesterase